MTWYDKILHLLIISISFHLTLRSSSVCPSVPSQWKGTDFDYCCCLLFVCSSCLNLKLSWCKCRVDWDWNSNCMNLCAEVGGKVSTAFAMQGLRCGHFIPSIVSGSLASRPVAAFVLFCVDILTLLAFASPPTSLMYRFIDTFLSSCLFLLSLCFQWFLHNFHRNDGTDLRYGIILCVERT